MKASNAGEGSIRCLSEVESVEINDKRHLNIGKQENRDMSNGRRIRGIDWYELVGVSVILFGLYSILVSFGLFGAASFSNSLILKAGSAQNLFWIGVILLFVGSEVRSHFKHLSN